jgi:hypothetical protein
LNTRDISLKISDNVRAYAVPAFLLVLETIPSAGIMAGSYYDPSTGILNLDSVTDYRSRCGYIAKMGFDAVGSSDLGGGVSEVLGGESGVVSNNQALSSEA